MPLRVEEQDGAALPQLLRLAGEASGGPNPERSSPFSRPGGEAEAVGQLRDVKARIERKAADRRRSKAVKTVLALKKR